MTATAVANAESRRLVPGMGTALCTIAPEVVVDHSRARASTDIVDSDSAGADAMEGFCCLSSKICLTPDMAVSQSSISARGLVIIESS
jgi:hypothetical protein